MPKFFEHTEYSHEEPQSRSLEDATHYLQASLQAAGSFEGLIIGIQYDYGLGRPEGERDIASEGQLYQYLRIARQMVDPTDEGLATKGDIHAFYAGELIASSLVDYMTGHKNSIPNSLFATFSKIREQHAADLVSEHQEYIDDNITLDDVLAGVDPDQLIPSEVLGIKEIARRTADTVWGTVKEFSLEQTYSDNISEALALIDSLIDSRTPALAAKAAVIRTGFLLVLREWLQPDTHDLGGTLDLIEQAMPAHNPQTLVQAARTAILSDEHDIVRSIDKSVTVADYRNDMPELADIEDQFADTVFEFDLDEWNRESLDDALKGLRMTSIRARATNNPIIDLGESPQERERLQLLLADYAKSEYGIEVGDLIYAAGTFVASSRDALDEETIALLDTEDESANDEELDAWEDTGTLRHIISQEDYQAINPESNDLITPYEIRGAYENIVYTYTVSDSDTYKVDIYEVDQGDLHWSFGPAIRLVNASLIDMHTGELADELGTVDIPITHSHLDLGRFIPPLPESD